MQEKLKNHQKPRIILAATGSVASIKLTQIANLLLSWAQIKIVVTECARKFINQEQLQLLKKEKGIEIYKDEDQWLTWNKRGDPVLHIELRKWADSLLIAPLSANTLAKITNGICDNLLTLIFRCWDMKLRDNQPKEQKSINQHKLNQINQKRLRKPIFVCPAMNTMMWDHPITQLQLGILKQWGVIIIDPIEKILVCGDQGKGALASLQVINSNLKTQLFNPNQPNIKAQYQQ